MTLMSSFDRLLAPSGAIPGVNLSPLTPQRDVLEQTTSSMLERCSTPPIGTFYYDS